MGVPVLKVTASPRHTHIRAIDMPSAMPKYSRYKLDTPHRTHNAYRHICTRIDTHAHAHAYLHTHANCRRNEY